MSSTNKTNSILLNQWVASDPVLREDFNADNEKIDAAIDALSTEIDSVQTALTSELNTVNATLTSELNTVKSGLLKVTTGSYSGNGKCGSSNPTKLTFSFAPLLVLITFDGYTAILCKGSAYANIFGGIQQGYNSPAYAWYITPVTWSGKTVSWYAGDASTQLSHSAYSYKYVAFGI